MPASVKCLLTLATCATVIPFCINVSNRSEATSNPPDTAMQPEAFKSKQRSRVKLFSKRTLVHQLTVNFRREYFNRQCPHQGRRCSFIYKMKTILPRLLHDGLPCGRKEFEQQWVHTILYSLRRYRRKYICPNSNHAPWLVCSSGHHSTCDAWDSPLQ